MVLLCLTSGLFLWVLGLAAAVDSSSQK
jgi:hypothetical protein